MAGKRCGCLSALPDTEKGFGFIQQQSGPDVFVHFRSIIVEIRNRFRMLFSVCGNRSSERPLA
ncbi:MAG: cold-shock protein [Gammaproteobacteria bacterium]